MNPEQHFLLDLRKRLAIPVLLEAGSSRELPSIRSLSFEQVRRNDVAVLGVVMKEPKNQENKGLSIGVGRSVNLRKSNRLLKLHPGLQGAVFNCVLEFGMDHITNV